MVAANEKLEAAVKSRQQQDGPNLLDGSCQCDLSTEHYEKLLSEEKERFELLNHELCIKANQVTELSSTLNDTKSNCDAEVTCLKDKISVLQVRLMTYF